MSPPRLLVFRVLLFLSALCLCWTEDWAFENAPGIAMEYKIHVDAGKEDCYWQYVHPKATIYVNMQVRTAVTLAVGTGSQSQRQVWRQEVGIRGENVDPECGKISCRYIYLSIKE